MTPFLAFLLTAALAADPTFVPPIIHTGNPDIARIQSMVKKAIARADGAKPAPASKGKGVSAAPAAKPSGHAAKVPANAGTTGGAIGNLSDGYAANQADDLGAAC